MKKKSVWVRSALVILVALTLLGVAGFNFLADEQQLPLSSGQVVEAATVESGYYLNSIMKSETEDNFDRAKEDESNPELELLDNKEKSSTDSDASTEEPQPQKNSADSTLQPAPVAEKVTEPKVSEPVQQTPEPIIITSNKSTEPKPVETVSEQPAAVPPQAVVQEVDVVENKETAVVVSPVSYSWGSSSNYTFRIEVKITNTGSDPANGVNVSVPLLENSSPYQTTTLKSVSHPVVSTSGRISTFSLGDLAPGETKTIQADFDIKVRTVSINSTNETIELARIAYEKNAGSGNCRTLAQGFIKSARDLGLNAREVIGFARADRGAIGSGSLQGSRHSWAEFYVDGLGWVPVDLTFKYFGKFPATSHVVESYSDQSVKVNYTGGSLSASWSNAIL